MHSYIAFILLWVVSILVALPFETVYLVSDLRTLALYQRILFKTAPVLLFLLSLLIGLCINISQRTPETGLIAGALFFSALGDMFLCFGDYETERKCKRSSYIWKGLGVSAFACVHICLIIAWSLSPEAASGGMDNNAEAAPLQLLLGIPFLIGALLLFAFLIYLKRLNMVEIIAISIYACIIGTACWRAAARLGKDLEEEYLSSQLLSMIGIFIFAISDFCIIIDSYLLPSKYSKWWVMSLYWIGESMLFLSSFLFKVK